MTSETFTRQGNLTKGVNSVNDYLLSQTFDGMAHFAGSGSLTEFCKTCGHFTPNSRKSKGVLKGNCGKFKSMMGRDGGAFPETALACRYHSKLSG